MDVEKTLRELYAEKKALDSTIASLERRLEAASRSTGAKKRGRKSMSTTERSAVSERMRKYWASRRDEMRQLDSQAAKAVAS